MHPQFLFSQLILNLGVHAERARGHCTNNVMENVFPSLILVNGQWAELTPPSSPFSVASILYTIYFLSGKPEWFLHLKLYSKMENLHLVTVALCIFLEKHWIFGKMHFWPNWPDLDVVTSVYGYSRLFSIELLKKILVTRWSPRNAIFRDFLGPCLTAYSLQKKKHLINFKIY